MATIRIVATDLVAQQLHQQALIENRTLSAMGLILLREGLEQRRAEQASREKVARFIEVMLKPTAPDAAS